jgi:hypothetical protein
MRAARSSLCSPQRDPVTLLSAPPLTRPCGSSASQLFLGDTNRTISETPMNHASSRSHCIFTIHVEARKVQPRPSRCSATTPAPPRTTHVNSALPAIHAVIRTVGVLAVAAMPPALRSQAGEDTVRRSKLNLVDLAGRCAGF